MIFCVVTVGQWQDLGWGLEDTVVGWGKEIGFKHLGLVEDIFFSCNLRACPCSLSALASLGFLSAR